MKQPVNNVKCANDSNIASLIQQVGNGVLIGISGGAATAVSFRAPLWVQVVVGLATGALAGYTVYAREKKERC